MGESGADVRRAAKVDDNHRDIVRGLRAVGAFVQSLAKVGDGCPDLLVGFRGETFIMEEKNPAQLPSKRRLNERQQAWHRQWVGRPAHVVETLADALRVIGVKHVSAGK